jgi:hypothetical protein
MEMSISVNHQKQPGGKISAEPWVHLNPLEEYEKYC